MENEPNNKPSLGFSIFLIIAGLAFLAEQLGWIPSDFRWGLPAILIAIGFSMLFSYFKKS
ncbi:MAG: hypothetical protein JNJ51_04495, partial [Methylobacillus glycogenes]|nr:hypothetical protein [Methylobacillus glycogenes]